MENLPSELSQSWNSGQQLGSKMGGAVQAVFGLVIALCAAVTVPWRLLFHTKWGERALLMGVPAAWFVANALYYIFDAIRGAMKGAIALIPMGPGAPAPTGADEPFLFQLSGGLLFACWLMRLLYVWSVEKNGPRPHSFSTGQLWFCSGGFWGMSFSNLIAASLGLVFLYVFNRADIAYLLIIGAIGGQLGEVARWSQRRFLILDARDQLLAGDGMAEAVGFAPDATNKRNVAEDLAK